MANNLDELISNGSSTMVPVESEAPSSSVPVESDSNNGAAQDTEQVTEKIDTSNESKGEMLDPDALDKRMGREIKPLESKVAPTDENLNPQDIKDKLPTKAEPPKPPINPVVTKLPTKPDGRDYSGFTEQEVAVLKKMPNEAFAYVAPKLKEFAFVSKEREELKQSYETLKKASDDFKYFDEHGYIKDEKFLEAKTIEDKGGQELNYWSEQLIKVESGEEWSDINGKVYAASPQAKVAIMNQIAKLNQIITTNVNKAEAIKGSWDAKAINYKKFWTDLEDKHFSNYKGKESDNKWIKGMDNTLIESGQSGNPLRGIVNKLFATAMELREAYTKLLNEKSVTKQAENVNKSAGPSSSSIVNGAINKDPSDQLSMDEFDDYKKKRRGY